MNASAELPAIVTNALQDAMEIALQNVPEIPGRVYVFPDVSGSMHAPLTGYRRGATTAVRCVDVAALVASALLNRNRDCTIIPFSDRLNEVRLNPRDAVMTNAAKLARLPSGGTNCSLPLQQLNKRKAKGDLIIYVSDNESWIDSQSRYSNARATETMRQWNQFKQRNPAARMICIDLQPYASTQAQEREDITNIGGFSDHVFELIADVAAGRSQKDHWTRIVENQVVA